MLNIETTEVQPKINVEFDERLQLDDLHFLKKSLILSMSVLSFIQSNSETLVKKF